MRWICLVVLLCSASNAQTLNDGPPPRHRFVHRNLIALRVNPLGLFWEGRFMYRLRLYESKSLALRDNYLSLGLTPVLSPAFLRVGPYIELAPATVATLWASLTFVQYFGSFDLFQSFPTAGAGLNNDNTFADSAIRSRGRSGNPAIDNYVTNGWELTLGLDLQLKAGPIVGRSRTRFVRGEMRLREGDRVYYDQLYDVAAPNRGWFWTNDVDVLWQGLENRLVVGARATFTVPFYDGRHFEGGETVRQLNALARVGPLVCYSFFSKDGRAINNPTIVLLVQWWVLHRYRTGADVPTALPLIGLAFQLTGDFIKLPESAEAARR